MSKVRKQKRLLTAMSREPTQTDEREIHTKRSRLGRLMGVQVVGIGSSVPQNPVRNEDLAALGYDAEWILQRTGILERRHVDPGEATSDLAAQAADEPQAADANRRTMARPRRRSHNVSSPLVRGRQKG